MRALSFALLALVGMSGNAWPWGDTGHQIVCEIAFRLAAKETRAEIRKLIRMDPDFDTFGESCIWPDHPRKRAEDHFINLPRNAEGLQSDDCPTANSCTLPAINKDLATLSSTTATKKEKLAALKFLGHWVGDIHQPLHVSFKEDLGGNDIFVNGECSGEFHSMWDSMSPFLCFATPRP